MNLNIKIGAAPDLVMRLGDQIINYKCVVYLSNNHNERVRLKSIHHRSLVMVMKDVKQSIFSNFEKGFKYTYSEESLQLILKFSSILGTENELCIELRLESRLSRLGRRRIVRKTLEFIGILIELQK